MAIQDKKEMSQSRKRNGAMSLRATYKLLTRERLIDAAIEIFGEIGFSNTTIEQIATRAGANRTTFYLHFKSKVDLASALIERAEPDINEVMLALNAISNPTWQDVRAWLDQWVALTIRQKVAFEVGSQLMTSSESGASASYVDRGRRFAALLENHLNPLGGTEREAALTRYTLLNMTTHQTICNKEFRDCQFPNNQHLDALADLWLASLRQARPVSESPTRRRRVTSATNKPASSA